MLIIYTWYLAHVTVFLCEQVDGVISCLASRSGTKSDSFAIDYQATLNCLEAAKKETVGHFVMLSAFCVKKPILQVRAVVMLLDSERGVVVLGHAGPGNAGDWPLFCVFVARWWWRW